MNAKTFLIMLIWGGLNAFPSAAAETYFLSDIGKIDNTSAEVRMNNDGVILVHHPGERTLLFAAGQAYDLTALLGVEKQFEGFDLNDNGVVVGRLFSPGAQEWRAVALLKAKPSAPFGTNVIDLGLLSTNVTAQFAAISVNNNGLVTVCCRDDGARYMVPILGGPSRSLPSDFLPLKVGAGNNIVGTKSLPPPNENFFHAALNAEGAGVMDLGTVLGIGPQINSTAVNLEYVAGRLTVVGSSGTGSRYDHAFRWDADSGMEDLDVKPHPEWEGSTVVHSINRGGEMVGTIGDIFLHAAMFKDGNVIDLNFSATKGVLIRGDFGWTLQTATAIDNYGQVAGWGNVKNGTEVRAFVLTPVRPFIELLNNQVRISWFALLDGFVLESTGDPTNPNSWQPVPLAPVTDGRWKVVTLDASGRGLFFRLKGA